VTVAPAGRLSTAVERAVAGVIVVSAVAPPESAARQKTSGEVSLDCMPQLLATVPTVGFGVCEPQSCASVLPTSTKSPTWFAW
jgi:hypothetical protein